jgi:hypothetical protein
VKSISRTIVESSKNQFGVEIKGVERVSEGERLPITTQISIGHARGRMAGSSQAPILILAAPDAFAPSIAMAIRTAAA